MNLVTLTGLRGGVGTSTMAGALGDALHSLEQRVLLVDLNASDLLRLHFDVPYVDERGWVASLYPGDWRRQALEVAAGFLLVPFGRKAIEDSRVSHLLRGDDFWLQVLPGLDADFDWVIFDCPPYPHRLAPALRFRSTLDIVVARPDMAAHVLLVQHGLGDSSRLLINGYDSSEPLERDIVQSWRARYGARVLSLVPQDTRLHEALAFKTTVIRHAPDTVVSRTVLALAAWCLTGGHVDLEMS